MTVRDYFETGVTVWAIAVTLWNLFVATEIRAMKRVIGLVILHIPAMAQPLKEQALGRKAGPWD